MIQKQNKEIKIKLTNSIFKELIIMAIRKDTNVQTLIVGFIDSYLESQKYQIDTNSLKDFIKKSPLDNSPWTAPADPYWGDTHPIGTLPNTTTNQPTWIYDGTTTSINNTNLTEKISSK